MSFASTMTSDRGADRSEKRLEIGTRLGAPANPLRALDRLGEALLLDGLQDVIDRMHLEGLDRVLVVGRDEYDRRRVLHIGEARYDLEAIEPRHLDIEEHDVGPQLPDRFYGLVPLARFAGDLDAGDRAENALQVLARGRFVVDDEDAQMFLLSHCPVPFQRASRL
jgi:hypothetical protein